MTRYRFALTRLVAFLVTLSAITLLSPAPASANTAQVTGEVTVGGEASTESTVELHRWNGTGFVLVDSVDVFDSPTNTYSFTALTGGNYYLVALPADDENYAPSYLANVTSAPTAQGAAGTFTLTATGSTIRNLALRQWGNGTAAGVISSAAGPLADATVSLYQLTGSLGSFTSAQWVDDVTTDATGAFMFPAFKADRTHYTIAAYYNDTATRRYLGGGTAVLEAQSWSHDANVAGKDITLNLYQLSGSVTGGNRVIEETTVVAFGWNADTDAWDYAGSSSLDAVGDYTIVLPLGSYSLLTNWYDGIYQSNYLNGTDVPPVDAEAAGVLDVDDNTTYDIALTSLGAPAEPTVSPSITGTGRTGTNLVANPGTWTNTPTFTYQWFRFASPIAGAIGATYEVVNLDAGEQLSVQVTAKQTGNQSGVATSNSIDGVGVFNAVVAPTLTGSGAFGTSLTVDPGTWSDNPTLARQWLRDGSPIPGATGLTYVPVLADLGEPISARVTATGNTFDPAIAVTNSVTITPGTLVPTTAAMISGGTGVGGTLTLSPGTWPTDPELTYQWLRDGVPISGETELTYLATMADLSAEISAEVIARQEGYSDAAETSNALLIAPGPLAPTSAPTLIGTARVGSTVTVSPGQWPSSPTFAFDWLRNGVLIPTAAGTTYVLTPADAGQRLQVRVNAAAPGYAGTALTSTLTIAKLTSTTSGKLAKKKVKAKKRAKYTVTVKVTGATPTGAVKIYDKSKVIARVTLTKVMAGKITVRLPKLKKGKHKIKATYVGTTSILTSTSPKAKLRVI